VSLVGRAAKLYTEKRLSARDVAAVLKAENGGKGPSHVWVAARLEERGLLRGRGGANRARAEKATAEVAGDPRDYAELEAEARRLAEDDRWSVRRIADELGLARHTVKRWLGDLAAGPAASIRQVAWESRRPETYERLRKRARVIELRAAGKTYPEIQAATGASRAMIYLYLRAAGLVKEQPARRRSRRKLPGESGRVG
jgi:DNA invertase Pin-like site-specific DNA recombinase